MNQLIEINELRIGNLLSYDNQIVHVTRLSLDIDDEYEDQIGFCKLGSVSNEIAAWNRSLVDKLAPIPLTPEWMERCGFISTLSGDDFHSGIIWDDPKSDYHYCESGYFIDNRGDYGHYCDIGDIKYLHQLQNLYFALTGDELIIKQ